MTTQNPSTAENTSQQENIVVTALYKFTRFDDYENYREPLRQLMLDKGVRGTLLLASEGINGTISGDRAGIDAVLDYIQQIQIGRAHV